MAKEGMIMSSRPRILLQLGLLVLVNASAHAQQRLIGDWMVVPACSPGPKGGFSISVTINCDSSVMRVTRSGTVFIVEFVGKRNWDDAGFEARKYPATARDGQLWLSYEGVVVNIAHLADVDHALIAGKELQRATPQRMTEVRAISRSTDAIMTVVDNLQTAQRKYWDRGQFPHQRYTSNLADLESYGFTLPSDVAVKIDSVPRLGYYWATI